MNIQIKNMNTPSKFKIVIDNGIHAIGTAHVVDWHKAHLGTVSKVLSYNFTNKDIGMVEDLSIENDRLVGWLIIDSHLRESMLKALPCVRVQYNKKSYNANEPLEDVLLLEVSLVTLGSHTDSNMKTIGEQLNLSIMTTHNDKIVIPAVREEDIIKSHPLMINESFDDDEDDKITFILKVIAVIIILAMLVRLIERY